MRCNALIENIDTIPEDLIVPLCFCNSSHPIQVYAPPIRGAPAPKALEHGVFVDGLYNEMTYFNGVAKGSNIDFMLEYYDAWGDPTTYPHMAAGWAVCFDSPFTWTKQVASNYGGTRNAMVIRYPDRIKGKGELRSRWHHVIDVVPTILEAAGLPQPRIVNGVPQRPSRVRAWSTPGTLPGTLPRYRNVFMVG